MFRKRETSDKDAIRIGWEYIGNNKMRIFNKTEFIGIAEKTSSRWFKGYLPNGEFVTSGKSLKNVGKGILYAQERIQ